MKFKKYLFIIINLIIVTVVLTSYTEHRKFVDPTAENFIRGEVKDLEEVSVNLSYENTLDESDLKEIQEGITSMPADVIKSFVDNDWKILVISNIDIPLNYAGYDKDAIAGLCDFDNKTIQIKIAGDGVDGVKVDKNYKARVLHELSHYADIVYGNASQSDDFKGLYEKYRDSFVEYEYFDLAGQDIEDIKYSRSDEYEMFACGMKEYVMHEDYLRENYTDMYVFFRNMIDKGAV